MLMRRGYMAHVAVLGSNGQLGSDVLKILGEAGHQILAATSADLDATAPVVLQQLQRYADVDYLINCIARTNVDGCEDNPELAFTVNAAFVTHLARFCNSNRIVLIHISTDYVYSGTATVPYFEIEQPHPLNVYGLSKYAGELAVAMYTEQYFILRVAALFGIAGASGKGGNFVTTMLKLANTAESIKVINDQWTCPTHTLDVARAINAFIQAQTQNFGIYNCVSSTACSWFTFTQEILRISGHDHTKVKPISYREYQFKAVRPQYGILNIDKLSKIYQMPSYQDALAEYLQLKGF